MNLYQRKHLDIASSSMALPEFNAMVMSDNDPFDVTPFADLTVFNITEPVSIEQPEVFLKNAILVLETATMIFDLLVAVLLVCDCIKSFIDIKLFWLALFEACTFLCSVPWKIYMFTLGKHNVNGLQEHPWTHVYAIFEQASITFQFISNWITISIVFKR